MCNKKSIEREGKSIGREEERDGGED